MQQHVEEDVITVATADTTSAEHDQQYAWNTNADAGEGVHPAWSSGWTCGWDEGYTDPNTHAQLGGWSEGWATGDSKEVHGNSSSWVDGWTEGEAQNLQPTAALQANGSTDASSACLPPGLGPQWGLATENHDPSEPATASGWSVGWDQWSKGWGQQPGQEAEGWGQQSDQQVVAVPGDPESTVQVQSIEQFKDGGSAGAAVISETLVADPSIDSLVAAGREALQELRQALESEAKHSRDMLVVHQTILEQRHEEESQLFERRRELIQRQEHFKDRLSDIARAVYAVVPDDPDVQHLSAKFGRVARPPEENGWHWQREDDISSLPWEAKDDAAKPDSLWQGTAYKSLGGGGSW